MRLRSALDEFLVPERELSLKLLFDNVRNYLIVAAFLAASAWLSKGAPNIPPYAVGPRFDAIAPAIGVAVASIGAILALLNLAQSVRLAEMLVIPLVERFIDASFQATKVPHPLFRRLRLLFLMVVFVAAALTMFVLAIALVAALTYVVVFGASGRQNAA